MQKLQLYHKTLIAQHLILIAAIIFFCVGSYFIGKQLIATLITINTAGNNINETFQVINRPRTGTIAGLNEAIFGASDLIKKSNGILDHEEKQLSTLDKQEAVLFSDLHAFGTNANTEVNNLSTATTTLNTLLGNINKSAEKAPDLIVSSTKIVNDADAKITDPSVQKLLNSLSDTSVQIEGVSTNVNKVITHLEQVVDNPKPMTVGQKIGAVFNILYKIGMLAK